jgi:hypothetical protein
MGGYSVYKIHAVSMACLCGQGNHSMMNQIRYVVARLRAMLLALAIRLHLHEQPRHYRQVAASELDVDAGRRFSKKTKKIGADDCKIYSGQFGQDTP